LYEQICRMDPQDPEARMMLGAAKAELGNTNGALADLNAALALQPGCPDAHFLVGNLLHRNGDLQGAITHLRNAVTFDPDYTEAWIMLSGLYGQLGEMAQVEDCCRRALALDPNLLDARMNHANVQLHQGKLDEAAENYREVLAQQPDFPMAWVMLGCTLRQAAQHQEAEAALRKALESNPMLAEAHFELGNVLKLTDRPEDALKHYQRALELNPESAEVHFGLGLLFHSLGQPDSALASYRQSLRINPDRHATHYDIGVLLQETGHPPEEISACYREALRLKPDFVDANHNLGRLLMHQGDIQGAVRCFEQILQYDPNNSIARYLLSALGSGDVPAIAPQNYVEKLFDDYAENFDRHLLQDLKYSMPEKLRNAVGRCLDEDRTGLDVLDLGCGTGLCGPLFRDIASRLTGIDLSGKMIEKARERRVYDELFQTDVTAALNASETFWDLVIATDVFIYLGSLDGVFAAVRTALKPGGIFAFSLEAADNDATYVLRPSGRYAQSSRYVRELAAANSLEEIGFENVSVRVERGQPLPGYILVFRKPQT
jgi:predicted TPR repeat methyltransferase